MKFKISTVMISPLVLVSLTIGRAICNWNLQDLVFIIILYALSIMMGWELKREVDEEKNNTQG